MGGTANHLLVYRLATYALTAGSQAVFSCPRPSLELVTKFPTSAAIRCLGFSMEERQVLAGLEDGSLLVLSLNRGRAGADEVAQ
jgi:hypothetical protein